MLAIAIVAVLIAAISAFYSWRSYEVSKKSAAEARRSADAAEAAVDAARQSASADTAADHRARTPMLDVKLESEAGYGQGETQAIYGVINNGPAYLESVILRRPQTDNSVHYTVASTGRSDFGDVAELGPLDMAGRTRFTLAVGPWVEGEQLPMLRVQVVCLSAGGDSWTIPFTLQPPRTPPARISSPTQLRRR
jgi:hypothetical protein